MLYSRKEFWAWFTVLWAVAITAFSPLFFVAFGDEQRTNRIIENPVSTGTMIFRQNDAGTKRDTVSVTAPGQVTLGPSTSTATLTHTVQGGTVELDVKSLSSNAASTIFIRPNGTGIPILRYLGSSPFEVRDNSNNAAWTAAQDHATTFFYAGSGNHFTLRQQSTGTAQNYMVALNDTETKFIMLGTGNLQNRNNSYAGISDRRLKENISDLENQTRKMMDVRIRKFSFKTDKSKVPTDIGVIAQELQKVYPELVYKSPDGMFAVTYSKFVPLLIKTVQEQQDRIEKLEARLEAAGL